MVLLNIINREKLGSFSDYNPPALVIGTNIKSKEIININKRGEAKIIGNNK